MQKIAIIQISEAGAGIALELKRQLNATIVRRSDVEQRWKDFNAFVRHRTKRLRDKLIKKLPWGWVKESQENLKVFTSVPKEFGMETVLAYMDEDHEDAKKALIERELDLIEFC